MDNLTKRKERGFSLIEVLISLTILAFGMLAVGGMQITSAKGGFSSSSVTNATILAQSKLEELKRLPYNDSNLGEGKHNEGLLPDSIFSRVCDIADISSTMKVITVTVRWDDAGEHSIKLTTVRAK
jgi:type IV pilus assembly protein PilV